MRDAAEAESLAGRIVLMPHVNTKRTGAWLSADGNEHQVKAGLDELHKDKIRLADVVIVVSDHTGYVGDSTRSEIAYAKTLGKRVEVQLWEVPATVDVAELERYRELDAGSLRDELIAILTREAGNIATDCPGYAADQIAELVQRWMDNPSGTGDAYRWQHGDVVPQFGGAS